jgi:hypothetical protein
VSGIGSRTFSQTRQFYADGKLVLPGFPAVAIGTSGNVNWAMDPFHSYTWRAEFLSLRWLDQYTKWFEFEQTYTYTTQAIRDETKLWLGRAQAYAADFARDNRSGGGPKDAWTAMYTGQRAALYTCLDYLTTRFAQPKNAGVRTGMAYQGTWLHDTAHDPGSWNQGVDAYVGLLAVGCAYPSSAWADHAATRLNQLVNQTIASDGSINEQAPGYGLYLWQRWGVAADVFADCGRAVPANLATRRSLLLRFLAWSSEPNGNVAQIGDSFRQTISPTTPGVVGTPVEWTGSKGTAGTAPSELFRTYSTGWGFGRSTWDPYTSSTWYAVRWGSGRKYHGHDDHQSVLLDALGHQVLVDSGHSGYAAGAYRDYLTSPAAHNVMTLPGVAFDKLAATTLVAAGGTGTWRSYVLSDKAYAGRTRARTVLADTALPFVAVFDRASRPSSGAFQQLWHLPAGTKVSVPSKSVAVGTSSDGRVKTTIVQLPFPGQAYLRPVVVSGRTSPYQGWVSYSDRQKTAAPVVVVPRTGTTASLLSVVLATPASSSVSAALKADPAHAGIYMVTIIVKAADGSTHRRDLRVSGGGSMSVVGSS